MRIQAVWDSGETDRLREFLTDDLIVELKPQLAERGGAANKTEVVLLNAELLGIETVSDGHLASVRFRACCARPRRRGLPLRGSLEPVQAGQRRLVAGRHPADPGRLRQLSLTSAAPIRTALAVRSQPALLGRFSMSGRKATLRPDPLHSRLAHCKNRQPAPWPLPIAFMLPLPFLPTPSRLAAGAQHAVEARRLGARAPGPPRRQDGALRAGRILAGPDHRQRRAGRAVRSGRGAGCDADGIARKLPLPRCPAVRRRTWPRPRIFPATRRWPRWWPTCPAVALGSRRRAGARGGRHRRAAPGGRGAQAGGRLVAGRPARGRECVRIPGRGKRPAAGPSGAGAMAPGPGRAGRARRGAGAVRRRSADETGRRWRKRGA